MEFTNGDCDIRDRDKSVLSIDQKRVENWPLAYQKNWLRSVSMGRNATRKTARNIKTNGKSNIRKHQPSLNTIGYVAGNHRNIYFRLPNTSLLEEDTHTRMDNTS